jgi:hypothetical protein
MAIAVPRQSERARRPALRLIHGRAVGAALGSAARRWVSSWKSLWAIHELFRSTSVDAFMQANVIVVPC